MTCKVSLCKSLRETLKHHLASVFAVCLIFFIKVIAFFLEVQSYATGDYSFPSDKEFIQERLHEMTSPGYGIAILIMFIAIFLAFDLFRYLHSKKQIDFYDSLPIRRKDWFLLRILTACLVFILPFIVSLSLETLLLVVFDFFKTEFLINILWNVACMVLVFLITMLTGVLAMIMTGHPIIALFGFCVFSAYAPILLQYIFPAYGSEYFDTYVSSPDWLTYLTYLSPVGASIKLVYSDYSDLWNFAAHTTDFIAIIILIVLLGILTYILFQKRPSEAAGQAMAFPKCNAVIRILLVIPLTLYVGLYLSQVASIGNKIWMVFGFIISTVLLHGIIESIFQFDIRGLWTHKKQMVGCLIASILVAMIFWVDLFRYDAYLPAYDDLEAVTFNFDHYYNDNDEPDGVSGEYLDEAYEFAKILISQEKYTEGSTSIYVDYHLKNGSTKERSYFIDLNKHAALFDKLYASEEYKDDICQLYHDDWSTIQSLTLSDGHTEITLNLSEEERELLFETYLAEFTPYTYTQRQNAAYVGYFTVNGDTKNYYDDQYSCYIFSDFTQTIALLDKYIQKDEQIRYFGSLAVNPINKYAIRTIEIYFEDYPISISDAEKIEMLKSHIQSYDYDSIKTFDSDKYYEISVELFTTNGISYAHGVIPIEIAAEYKN